MSSKTKYVVAVPDGMADEPIEKLGGRTPLGVARKPKMDSLARQGVVGMVRTVPQGMPPGSDVANLTLFGYAPEHCYTGRAPLEAASLGVRLGPDDLAFRCNLVRLDKRDGRRVMADYSGGGIASDWAGRCVHVLQEALGDSEVSFHAGVSYRHVIRWKNVRPAFEGLRTTPPHDITDQDILPHLPHGPGQEKVAGLMERACGILASGLPWEVASALEGKVNAIWLWGQGPAPAMIPLTERFGIRGVTVCAVDLVKGLGHYAGLRPIRVPGATGDLDTDYRAKAHAALEALEEEDFVFLHVEAPDEAGHRGNLEAKIEAIERFDADVLDPLYEGLVRRGNPFRLLVCPDHPTPLRIRTHTGGPVPFLLCCDPQAGYPVTLSPRDWPSVRTFEEASAARTGLFFEKGHELLTLFLGKS